MATHRARSNLWWRGVTSVNAVGSGLILLVIVGAWLAVLVPMALRSHDSATSLRSADRFGVAMRVLARRGAGRDVLMPRRGASGAVLSGGPATSARGGDAGARRSGRRGLARMADTVRSRLVAVRPRQRDVVRSAAERRRRTLLVLLAVALVSLVAGMVGPAGLLAVHVVADLLLLTFVVHLRRQAVLRAGRRAVEGRLLAGGRSPAPRSVPAARTVPRVRVAGVPDRMPQRPAPLATPLPAPAARYDEPVPAATGTDGPSSATSWNATAWSPVPVPPPTYVGKPVAPARRTRVLDLTRPGQWTAAMEQDEGLSILDDGPDLDEILDRRRAVNDW